MSFETYECDECGKDVEVPRPEGVILINLRRELRDVESSVRQLQEGIAILERNPDFQDLVDLASIIKLPGINTPVTVRSF